jgi:hypothetical protein
MRKLLNLQQIIYSNVNAFHNGFVWSEFAQFFFIL